MAVIGGLQPGQLGITLFVRDAGSAAQFYKVVLGAEIVHSFADKAAGNPNSRPSAVTMRLGDAHITVASENPNWKEAPRSDWPRSPHSAGTTTAFFTLYVDDVDAAVARALAAGATLPNAGEPVQDTHWGDRVGQFTDPAGHVWRLQTAREEVTFESLPDRLRALSAARMEERAGSGSKRSHPS